MKFQILISLINKTSKRSLKVALSSVTQEMTKLVVADEQAPKTVLGKLANVAIQSVVLDHEENVEQYGEDAHSELRRITKD